MISVCMATHNGEKYLQDQLQSILVHLGQEDEVIISDDSSTDGSLAIIKAFDDPRIRLLENNTFYSPIYNFENALKHVTGEIITLADQDDVWLANKVEVIRQGLENKRGRPALIMMDGYVIDGEGNRTDQTIFMRQPSKHGLLANLYDNTFTGCTMAFTRELLEQALPFPSGIPMHDSWLGMLALIFGEVEFVDTKTMEYRRHDSNVSFTHRNPLRQIRWRLCLGYQLGLRYFVSRDRCKDGDP